MNNNKNLSYDDFYKVNVELSIALFKHAAKKNIKKFIFFSSINCEKTDNKFDHYSKTKLIAEKKLFELSHSSDVELFILRLPPVLDRLTNGNLKYFYEYMKFNLPLIIPTESTKNLRAVIEIDNIIVFIHKILSDKVPAGRYSICKSNSTSTYDLIKSIKVEIGSNSMVLTLPSQFFIPLKILLNEKYNSLFGNLNFNKNSEFTLIAIND